MKRFRFSLRLLCLALGTVAFLCALLAVPARDARKYYSVVRPLEAVGVRFLWDNAEGASSLAFIEENGRFPTPLTTPLERLLGFPIAREVVGMRVDGATNGRIGVHEISMQFPHLRRLDITEQPDGIGGLAELRRLQNLESLSIIDVCRLDSRELTVFKYIPKLRVLHIDGRNLTPGWHVHFRANRRLQRLYLYHYDEEKSGAMDVVRAELPWIGILGVVE